MTIDPTLQRFLSSAPGLAAQRALAAEGDGCETDGCECGPGCGCDAGSCGCGS